MVTKAGLIKRAEESFPEEYQNHRKYDRDKIPKKGGFPLVNYLKFLKIVVSDEPWLYEHLEVELYIITRKKKKIILYGMCSSDEDNCECSFTGTEKKDLLYFAEFFTAHLIFNILPQELITPEEWKRGGIKNR